MKKVTHYFAYGSNMNRLRAGLRIPGALDIGRASLQGWKVVERLYADIVPKAGATAEGVLYRVGDAEIAELDRYEGHPAVYERRVVTTVWRDRPVRAWTYFMAEPAVTNRTGLRYPEWYRLLCRDGAREHGLRHNAFLRPRPAAGGIRPRQMLLPLGGREGTSFGGVVTEWPEPGSRAPVHRLFLDVTMPDTPFVEAVLKTGREDGEGVYSDGARRRRGRLHLLSDRAFKVLDYIVGVPSEWTREPVRIETADSNRMAAWRYARR